MAREREPTAARPEAASPPRHIRAEESLVSPGDRVRLLGQRGVTVWLTGLSGSGKSTTAKALEQRLFAERRLCCTLDGDTVRHGLNSDLGFSEADRRENIRRIAEVARLFNGAGLIVIAALISPRRADRDMARRIVGEDRFLEVYISTPLSICERRDSKQLYRKARSCEIHTFTGVSDIYEPPLTPALSLDTSVLSAGEILDRLLGLLRRAPIRQDGGDCIP